MQTNNARIVYNPHNTGSSPAYRAFSGAWEYSSGSFGYLRAYDLSTPSNETWEVDNNYGPTSQVSVDGHLDLTYRGTGKKITIWKNFYWYRCIKIQI